MHSVPDSYWVDVDFCALIFARISLKRAMQSDFDAPGTLSDILSHLAGPREAGNVRNACSKHCCISPVQWMPLADWAMLGSGSCAESEAVEEEGLEGDEGEWEEEEAVEDEEPDAEAEREEEKSFAAVSSLSLASTSSRVLVVMKSAIRCQRLREREGKEKETGRTMP